MLKSGRRERHERGGKKGNKEKMGDKKEKKEGDGIYSEGRYDD